MNNKKNKNKLCSWCVDCHGFNGVIETYNRLLKEKKELTQRMNDFEEKTKKSDEELIGKLKFKEKKYIYDLIVNLLSEEKDNNEKWRLGFIKENLRETFEDLDEYCKISRKLENVNELLEDIDRYISFDGFWNDNSHKTCSDKHFLVRLEDELVCMRCGESSKNYNLTDEELDFLTLCADKQHCLIDRITEDEIPFINVLMAEHQYYREHRKSLDEIPEDQRIDYEMEYSMTDDEELGNIQRELKVARALDYYNISERKQLNISPSYLSGSRMTELYKEIERTIEEIENSDSQYKDLLLEQCAVAQYELYILNGYIIPRLLNSDNLDKKIALVKAYYNLSRQDFRIESGYFESSSRDTDALSYSCRTANPEINQMILDLKLKR